MNQPSNTKEVLKLANCALETQGVGLTKNLYSEVVARARRDEIPSLLSPKEEAVEWFVHCQKKLTESTATMRSRPTLPEHIDGRWRRPFESRQQAIGLNRGLFGNRNFLPSTDGVKRSVYLYAGYAEALVRMRRNGA